MKITMKNNGHSHRKMCHEYAQEWAKGLGHKCTIKIKTYTSGAAAADIWDKDNGHYLGRLNCRASGTVEWRGWEHGSGWSYREEIDGGWHPDPAPIEYAGGESRTNPGQAADYMLGHIDDIELYAETPPIDGDETGTYEVLAAEILRQAAALGIDRHHIRLHWDD